MNELNEWTDYEKGIGVNGLNHGDGTTLFGPDPLEICLHCSYLELHDLNLHGNKESKVNYELKKYF